MFVPKKKKLFEVSRALSEVALGQRKADMVIKNGTLVNVISGELLEHTDIAISNGRIAYVGQALFTIGPDTIVLDAEGKYLTPGLMDGHMHVESTMLSVTEFAKAALIKGTTSIFMDPHEIANVFGTRGIQHMHDEGQQLPLKVFTTFPSCVPATDGLEDAGASLDVNDIKEGLDWNNVVGLGEVMNFPGVVYGDSKMAGEIEATIKANKTVTGHFPDGSNEMLQAYIAHGVTSCHETVTREQGLEKIRLGMYLMIREGSAWHDVKEVIKIITEDKVNSSQVLLVTDDVYPQTLVEKGHLNHVVRRAIEEGVNPVTAIQMATINVARYFNQTYDLGSLAPGKCADILIVDNLADMEPTVVLVDGEVVVNNKQLVRDFPTYEYPADIKSSVNLNKEIKPADFQTYLNEEASIVDVNVIKAIENSARTEKMTAQLQVHQKVIQADIKQDIIRLACMERHRGTGQISNGFVHGFQIKEGAVASTVAHDSHNLLVMGIDENDMAIAANKLASIGGGTIVVRNGIVLAQIELPIAGLMSDKPLEVVVEQVAKLDKAWKEIGCVINAPFMTFSLIALPVIPELRISNRGLVDVTAFELINTVI